MRIAIPCSLLRIKIHIQAKDNLGLRLSFMSLGSVKWSTDGQKYERKKQVDLLEILVLWGDLSRDIENACP